MPVPRYASADAWPLLSAGFRPFFLAAGLWACLSMALWIAMLSGTVALPTAFGPVAWHFHELLFGFVAAAIAGFLLTAIPNWTGRLPLQGWPLGGLVLLWIAGRVAVAFSLIIGPGLAAAIDLSFLIVFAAVVAREIVAGRNWRNLPVLGALTVLTAANAMIHAGAFGHYEWEEAGKRLAIAVVIMLISLIGGRIIPSFTTNWLRRQDILGTLPVPFDRFDKGVLALGVVVLALWVVTGLTALSGAALIFAGLVHALRLARWRGAATLKEPLLWILHIGYAWLPVGLVLLGSAAWHPALATSALHALTVGAMGTMILAVMTRASLGHSKRELTAGRGTLAVYLLVLLAALARLAAPFAGSAQALALDLAAGAWIAAFALFVALYIPLYIRR
ncbi:NnrS family protein [Parvibaculum sp.]|uniref:NnrS family protein n=1 Tax=Parvibaculum sp. TaxID=2024848 RepID=UPI00349FD3A0